MGSLTLQFPRIVGSVGTVFIYETVRFLWKVRAAGTVALMRCLLL